MRLNQTILGLFKKEMAQTFRDKRMWAMLFIMPIVQMGLFGLAISTEVKNIKLGALYEPNDTLMRRAVEHCLASKWFIPAQGEEADAFHWVQSGRADAVLVAPAGGLTRAVERGKGEVQLLVNASNVLKAQNIEGYVTGILGRLAAQEKALPGTAPIITLKPRVLYNPELKTSLFMVPAVLCMLLCVLTIMLTSMAFTREKELGTFEALIASPAKPWEILLGKSLPFVVLAMADFPLVLATAILGFGLPMRGSYLVLFIAGLTFVGTTVSIGILISTVARTQQQAMMASFLFLFPALQLSGILFPVENMPLVLRVTAYLDPLKYFIELIRNIMLKGGDAAFVAQNLGALAVMAVVAILLTFNRFKRTLN